MCRSYRMAWLTSTVSPSNCFKCLLGTVVLLIITSFVTCACPPADASEAFNYTPINESLYDRNYSSITSGRHPLGFYSSAWYYNQNMQNPCVKLSALSSGPTNLEIMVETIPPARLCAQIVGMQLPQCSQTGKERWCIPLTVSSSKTVYVEFFCDERCEQADVNFWYRLVLMPTGERLDTWCSNDRSSMFPSGLMTLPQDVTLPALTKQQQGTSGVCRTMSSMFAHLLFVFCFLILTVL